MEKLQLNNYKVLEGIQLKDGWMVKSVTESVRLYKIELIKDGYKPIKWKLQRNPTEDTCYYLEAEDSSYPLCDYEANLSGILFAIESELEDVNKMRWIRSGGGVVLG